MKWVDGWSEGWIDCKARGLPVKSFATKLIRCDHLTTYELVKESWCEEVGEKRLV